MKLKVGDKVVVKAGKDKGKSGEILKIHRDKDQVVVKGVNMQTKHVKKGFQSPGQKIEREGAIHASNVMILCPKTNKPSRIGYRVLKDGSKERYAKASNEPLS